MNSSERWYRPQFTKNISKPYKMTVGIQTCPKQWTLFLQSGKSKANNLMCIQWRWVNTIENFGYLKSKYRCMHLFCIFIFFIYLLFTSFFLIFIVVITNKCRINITKVCITTVSLYIISINILYKESHCDINFCDNNGAFVGYNKNSTRCMVHVLK
jgi:hypothetical protein